MLAVSSAHARHFCVLPLTRFLSVHSNTNTIDAAVPTNPGRQASKTCVGHLSYAIVRPLLTGRLEVELAQILTVFGLTTTGGSWSFDQLASVPTAGLLARAQTAFRILDFAGERVLAAYSPGQAGVDIYKILGTAPWLSLQGTVSSGAQCDILNGFCFSNTRYVVTYQANNGDFDFYSLDATYKTTGHFSYSRTHAPAATAGFTMVRSFKIAEGIMLMGYNFNTGAICTYRAAAVSSSPQGTPPMAIHTVWDHVWAPGWTRFAFFSMASEVFFLKTNTKFPTVNIDHVLDNPDQGTSEVSTRMKLADAQSLTIVEPFVMDNGHPHFIAYRPDGTLVVYKFHTDCQSWDTLVTVQTPANATEFLPGLPANLAHTFLQISGS